MCATPRVFNSRTGPAAIGLSLLLMGAAPGTAPAQQVSFELRTRFVFGWGDAATPITDPIQITSPGRYDFELQEGVYNAVGFTNFGVANWIGTIHSTEPMLTRPTGPRQAPFNQIGRDGDVRADGMEIGLPYIDAAHAWERYVYTQLPAPVPAPYGADEFVSLYRFSIMITDLSTRDIEITAQSIGLSRPLSGWFVIQDIPPDPETGEPGLIDYRPLSLPSQYAQDANLSLALIHVIPTPGAGMLLGSALFLSGRRRTRQSR